MKTGHEKLFVSIQKCGPENIKLCGIIIQQLKLMHHYYFVKRTLQTVVNAPVTFDF